MSELAKQPVLKLPCMQCW